MARPRWSSRPWADVQRCAGFMIAPAPPRRRHLIRHRLPLGDSSLPKYAGGLPDVLGLAQRTETFRRTPEYPRVRGKAG